MVKIEKDEKDHDVKFFRGVLFAMVFGVIFFWGPIIVYLWLTN